MSHLIVLLLNRALRDQISEVFTQKGFQLSLVERDECSKESINKRTPDIVLFDVGMHSDDDFLLYLDIVRWSEVPVLPVIYRKENSHCTMLQAQELLKDVEAILLGTDYSDQKENLATVKEYPYALTHYHDIFETIPYAIFLHDSHTGEVLDVNVAATELFGYSRTELMTENPSIAYPPNTQFTLANAMEHIDKAITNGADIFEWSAYKKSGELMWLKVHLSLVAISNKTVIMAVVHDITQERQLKKALEASEERFKAIFEEFTDGLLIIDEHGIIDCNKAAEEIFGFSKDELLGLHPADISPPKQPDGNDSRALANRYIKEALTKKKIQFRWVHQKKNGNHFWADVTLVVIHPERGNVILVTCKDITNIVQYEKERKELSQHIHQLQKMEAVATLASGIAHDFNNMLTSIIGNLNLSTIYLEKKDFDYTRSLQQSIDAATASATQAAELVKKLLSFSRKITGNVENVKIQDVMNDVKTICTSSFPKIVTVVYKIPQSEIYVATDKVLLTQALINCCINASHAVTIMRKNEPQGGTITIECVKRRCSDTVAAVHPEANPDVEYAIITISDDGVGMDEQTQQRIFEPFFSTKDKSISTGLGLSIVYSTITNAGGFIHVDSAPGRGTAVSLYLPSA
jgi:PAS domain S-box-containing protein